MAEITLPDLTVGEGSPTGTGVFDKLMKASAAHIQREYKAGRIKGGDYATVYLGAMQAVMQQSVQFLLTKQEADKRAELLAEQALTEQQQQALLTQQTANAVTENTVLVAQECKLRAEYDVLLEQKLKTIAETALLNQKKVTEQAQTDGTGVGTNSVIGKQTLLYQRQADGYLRDAEQKAAKLMADTWSVRMTNDPGTLYDTTNHLSDSDVGRAISSMLTGINA